MALPPLVLGLDIGTQSVRAALFDASGHCHGYATSPLETRYPQPGWAEQRAESWWQAACLAVPGALAQAQAPATHVIALGLDATACTVIPCRMDGTPLRPALLWMDQRAVREAEDISATGDPTLRYVSGVVSPEWMLPKALWLKRHEPATYLQAERLIECVDWLMHRLTGQWTLSRNNVAVKWNYARPDGGWSPALLRGVGLDDLPGKWPSNIVPLGGGDGRLCAPAAGDLGLPAGLPVAQGGIDAYLGMLGMGATRDGDLALILGSSTCHLAMSRIELLGSGLLGCYPDAVVEGLYTLEGGQTATGSILDWYRRHFAGHERIEAERTGRAVYEILDAKAAEVAPGSEGLICLDHWQGNRCPLKDPRSRGVFLGLTLAHGPGHLVRSIYEGTAHGTRQILEDATAHGFRLNRLFAGGGGAKSRLWMQIHADILNRPIQLPRESEACALGSALTAAVQAGWFATLDDAAEAMVRQGEVIDPHPEQARLHDQIHQRYRAVYPALRELLHQGQ